MTLRAHPLNRGFAWTDHPRDGLRVLSPAQVTQYDTDGYCVLRGVVDVETIAALVLEIDAIERKIESYEFTLEGFAPIAFRADDMTFSIDLFAQAPAVVGLCRSPLFGGILRDLVGDDVRLYWSQAVYKKPEKGRVFPWHQDNGYTFTEPQAYLTCWLPLSEATRETGCPWLVRGIHRRGTLTHRRTDAGLEIDGAEELSERACAVEASPGDILLFSSLTPHRTGANVSQLVRKALILQFAPDGMVRLAPDGARTLQDDPVRNPLILSRGCPVPPVD